MRLFFGSFLLIFFAFFSNESAAQTHPLKFSVISELDGVPTGKINSITRDAQGVIWLADQPNRWILRYDGAHATKYVNDPKNPNTLGGIYPECIVADSTGIIWIGFYETGLDRFDPVTGKFTHYRHSPADAGSLANDTISALLIDHLGNLWVGNNGGLDLLDQKSGKFQHFSYDPKNKTSLSNNVVRALYEDHEGTIWVGAGFVFGATMDNDGGLNRFDRKTGTFTRFLNDPKNPQSLVNNKVRAIFEDSRGTFWVGTAGDGLHTMNRKTGQFERHPFNPANPGQLSRAQYKGGFDHITFITEDAEKQLWIGTYSNGLTRYDPATKKITRFGADEDKTGGFKDIGPWTAYASKDGLLWISTEQNGLYDVDLYTNSIPVYRENGGAYRFYEEPAFILWIGTDKGLVRKDLKTGNARLFQIDQSIQNAENNNSINVITRDRQGNFWAGTNAGLYQFDPNTGIFSRYRHESDKNNSLASGSVIQLYQDNASNVWVGTFNKGVYMFNAASGVFKHFEHIQGDTNSLSNNLVPNVLEDQSGDLWISTWSNGGLDRLNARTGKIRHYLSGNSIGVTVRDKDGAIWVAGANDLYRYIRSIDEFTTMSEENPAFEMNDVRSLICDHENNLWLGTSRGIYKINPKRDRVTIYGKQSGIPVQDLNYLAAFETKEGQLFFGGSLGYFPFYPDSLKLSPLVPKITFTNFWIGNEEIKPGNNSVLTEAVFNTQKINLTYKQNVFSFGFSSVDYGKSDNRSVLYKLENYDKEWRPAGAESKVYYFNVPPGKYVLKVKAVNKVNSLWQEKEISIIISPPWWNRWWAWVLFGLATLGILRFYIVFRSRKLRREKQALEEKVNLRTQQLQQSMDDLKATQAQLIQSEKMASLGELTAGIAHEIQNPLNFVNNFSEVNVELLNELKEGPLRKLPEDEKKEAEGIVEDISQNLEKISFHGKRADGIVKGMLQHSRSSSGIKEPTDINALADEYFRLAYHGLRAKDKSFNATLKTDFDKSLSAEGGNINIIPQDIGRVLLNLYNNAFYAVSEKNKQQRNGYDPTVTVSTKRISGKTEIKVKDNGNGIPQKVWDKIFQPFFTTKPTGEGTGLGLSLAYDIVKAHGGQLKVNTKEGEGTEFVIELPT